MRGGFGPPSVPPRRVGKYNHGMPETIENARPAAARKPKTNAYPWYSPRFWHGMRLGDWLSLAARHRCRIHPIRWPMAFLVTPCTLFNTVMAGLQRARHGKRIRETPIEQPPIFIIGHWRSGTTHLHELMVLDERFGYPTTYQCMAPHHYLLTEWFFRAYANFLIPSKRPMDNMAAGWSHPQEDEFALMNLGAPSIYTRIAFPNEPPEYFNTLDIRELPAPLLARWTAALESFVRTLTFDQRKRIVLKSPPHTGRVAVLAKLFPGAKFIHIARSPYAIFPSTQKLWRSLDDVQGFQLPRHRDLDEFIFSALEAMYRGYEAQRAELAPGQLYEVRYEDLVRDPVGELRRIYETLGLGDFAPVEPRLEAYLQSQRSYVKNEHQLDPELKAEIRRRWAGYIERYGYADE
jgi:omega-hydroxy-beta-dihydromenaquinone-9 sulfotransferase